MKMKKRTLSAAIALIMVAIVYQYAAAAIPEIISYQGILSDSNGEPLTGNFNITIRIYDVATAGTALWSETHPDVPVSNGVFNIMLGSVTPFSPTIDFTIPYWLGISVNAGAELTPRSELASVPTAITAKNVVPGQVVKSVNNAKDDVNISLDVVTATCSTGWACVAQCPAGYVVVGGGGSPNTNGNLILSRPYGQTGWQCGLANGGACYSRCIKLKVE